MSSICYMILICIIAKRNLILFIWVLKRSRGHTNQNYSFSLTRGYKWFIKTRLICIIRYNDVIMTTIASQITSLTVVCSTVYSDADQRKHQSSASLAFVWGIHRDRWIPRTKGELRGKCFHLMTSSCSGYSFEFTRAIDLTSRVSKFHHYVPSILYYFVPNRYIPFNPDYNPCFGPQPASHCFQSTFA